jgi:hypothetical protein
LEGNFGHKTSTHQSKALVAAFSLMGGCLKVIGDQRYVLY